MKFVVKIDPASVTKNRDPGWQSGIYYAAGRRTVEETIRYFANGMTFTHKYVGSELGPDGRLLNGTKVSESMQYGLVGSPGFSVSIKQDSVPLHRLPSRVPKFDYDYKPTPVQCHSCELWHNHTELYYGPDYANICPACGCGECCEIVYEKPTDGELEKLMSSRINQVSIA